MCRFLLAACIPLFLLQRNVTLIPLKGNDIYGIPVRFVRRMELKSHRFISFFEPEQAAQLSRVAIVEQLPDRTVIFEEGERPDFLYLVLAGKVEFRKCQNGDQYKTVAEALPDDFFGEFGILDGQPRSAQAIVCKQATLAKIPRIGLIDVLEKTKSTVVLNLFSYIVQRLRTTTEEYVKELVYKDRMVLLGETINTIIHDLKSPLSAINLASSLIKEIHPDKETIEWSNIIRAQAQQMLSMAQELLEFSQGQGELHKNPVNLAQVLQTFEKLNQIYFQQAGVELFINCPEDIVLDADKDKLLRVLQNLANNSVEAFKNRGGRIEVMVWSDSKIAHIKFYDNGPGIPEKIHDRLFESFVTYGKATGTGLGTAIVKSIIDAHKGEISAHSHPDRGTTFEIKIPID